MKINKIEGNFLYENKTAKSFYKQTPSFNKMDSCFFCGKNETVIDTITKSEKEATVFLKSLTNKGNKIHADAKKYLKEGAKIGKPSEKNSFFGQKNVRYLLYDEKTNLPRRVSISSCANKKTQEYDFFDGLSDYTYAIKDKDTNTEYFMKENNIVGTIRIEKNEDGKTKETEYFDDAVKITVKNGWDMPKSEGYFTLDGRESYYKIYEYKDNNVFVKEYRYDSNMGQYTKKDTYKKDILFL